MHAVPEEHLTWLRRLAHKMARRCRSPVLGEDDMLSVATVAAAGALERWDPARGCSARTYAERRARGAILDALRSVDWAPRGERMEHGSALPRVVALDTTAGERGLAARRAAEWDPDFEEMVDHLLSPLDHRDRLLARRYLVDRDRTVDIARDLGITRTRVYQLVSERILPMLRRRAARYVAA